MSYQILVYINIIALAFMEMFIGADVSVEQALAADMAPSSQQKVSVTVHKDDITGFAKLQLDLPEGLTAVSNDTKGASFTFKDQKAKFIWMSLPTQATYKISYELVADANAAGTKTITGKLSYIENNERKTFNLPPVTVDLGGTPVAEEQTTNGQEDLALEVESNEDANDLAMEGADGITSEMIVNQAGVSGIREITRVSNTEFLVTVKVQKGDIRGFGKVQEILPPGFTALEKSSTDAIFTFQDEIVKFVWLNLPAAEELEVVYKLRSGNNPDGEYSINGEFSYLLEDETQKTSLGSTTFSVGEEMMVAEVTEESSEEAVEETVAETTEETVEEVTEEVTSIEEAVAATIEEPAVEEATEETVVEEVVEEPAIEVVEETVADVIEEVVEESTESASTSNNIQERIPAPETGISYKVQITAGHNQVGNDYFSQKHKFNGMFNIEHHEGWIKYTTGSYNAYKAARDRREELNAADHQFPGPFVTAYNDGTRVTVQEALMISNQKWLQ